MAAYVGEGICFIGGKPVLEIGVPVQIRFYQFCLTHPEFSELAGPVPLSCLERPPVKPFMVLHPDKQSFGKCGFLYLFRLSIAQNEGLDRKNMLIRLKCFGNHLVMKLIGHRHHHCLPGLHTGKDLLIKVGETAVRTFFQ